MTPHNRKASPSTAGNPERSNENLRYLDYKKFTTIQSPRQHTSLACHFRTLLDQAQRNYFATADVRHLALVGHFAKRLAEGGRL